MPANPPYSSTTTASCSRRRAGEVTGRPRGCAAAPPQHVAQLHDPDDLAVVGEHGIAGVPRHHPAPHLTDRLTGGHRVDRRRGHHRVLYVAGGEVEHAVEQERQLGCQVAARLGVGDDLLEVAP